MTRSNIVLVAEDNDTIRMLLRYSLEPMGYETVEARDGREGLAVFKKLVEKGTPPLLILSDLDMPNMDGFEFIEAVRAIDQEIPVLFLTAQSEPDVREKGRQIGANGWVVKPFVSETVRESVRKVLGDA